MNRAPGQNGKSPMTGREMAGELGFEPRLTESESAVLPLDDSPSTNLRSQAEEHLEKLEMPVRSKEAPPFSIAPRD